MLPLFPLGVVLFPRAVLPLHIFEDRYKEMIGDSIRNKTEFGVVLATGKGIANVGCTASVEQVFKTYDDGRMDILTTGRRRFEIAHLNDERAYLRGDVEFFDDEDPDQTPAALRTQLEELARRLDPSEFTPGDPRLSFQVAYRLTDLETKQILLSMRSEEERVRYLLRYLPDYLNRQKLVERVRELAPRNGHSKHLQGAG
jgi:Lon protease-like protein